MAHVKTVSHVST